MSTDGSRADDEGRPGPGSRAACAALDAADPLASLRSCFDIPHDVVYLDGNSLGPPPRGVRERVLRLVDEEWGRGLVRSWNDAGWIDAPRRCGARIARLIGARQGEVVVCDSTSVDVFKAVAAALRLRPGRRVVLTREADFPTDGYVVDGLAALTGTVRRSVPAAALEDALDDGVAVLLATHVDYRTGELLDMRGLTRAAHAAGALAIWDLAHSAGAMPLDVKGCDVDLAVGCGYKYLNGGPGAPAFVMAATRLHDSLEQPLSGWLGHADPFAFEAGYRPAPGMTRMLTGTPPMLAMAALEAALEVWDGVDLDAVRAKSIALGELMVARVDARCAGGGVSVASPRDASQRGSQVSLRHQDAFAICQALIARGVIGDFREPDILRLGLAPLYVRFVDVWDAVEELADVLEAEEWRRPENALRRAVT